MKLILYFSDAFGWQYVERTPFMQDFWTERRPLETVLGYSSTILPCLVSGEPPQRTGIWTEYYRHDRPQSPAVKHNARCILESGSAFDRRAAKFHDRWLHKMPEGRP